MPGDEQLQPAAFSVDLNWQKPGSLAVPSAQAGGKGRQAEVLFCLDAPPHELDPRWPSIALPQFLDALLARDRLSRTFAGSRIGARSLTSDRQPLAVPQAPVTPDVSQPGDGLLDLAAELALDREVVIQERRAKPRKLVLSEVAPGGFALGSTPVRLTKFPAKYGPMP